MDIGAMMKSPLPDGGADDQAPADAGDESDPVFAALDQLRDQIDQIEAQLMAQKKPEQADAVAPMAPPDSKVSV